jgi:hypothetical protein
MKMGQAVPKRPHIKFRHSRITQKRIQQDELSSDFLFLCPVEKMKQEEERNSESPDATLHITIKNRLTHYNYKLCWS